MRGTISVDYVEGGVEVTSDKVITVWSWADWKFIEDAFIFIKIT